jgi:homoserine dehydrogenase
LEKIRVGLMGLGTVGTGVAKILKHNADAITKKVGVPIELAKVLVRNIDKPRGIMLSEGILTTDPDEIIDDPKISIVIEVMGGINPTKELLNKALTKGKHVVTANKDLVALHGKELFESASASNSGLFFEASVAGGIPIIRPLKECLAGNNIEEIMGIINGTTNYILTKMTSEGLSFEKALNEAQELGYAEADPTADIEGYDAARKIAILASVAFGTRVTFTDVFVEGITKITSEDINYAKDLNYVIKLLGIAKSLNGKVEVRVHPAFIPLTHPLAAVNDVFNAIFVKGDAVGETMFFGKGAGEMPTASAIVGDVIRASRDLVFGATGRIGCTCFDQKDIMPMGEITSKYFFRFTVTDRPGVLASIAGVLGNHDVSIASVIQKHAGINNKAEIVLITHEVKENAVQDAMKILSGMSIIHDIASVIRVEGGDS